MTVTSSNAALLTSVTTHWAKTLATLDTVLERLILIASLRDPHTGLYVHHGMSLSLGNEQTHMVLLTSHLEIFAEWQTMGLRDQMREFKSFVAAAPLPSLRPRVSLHGKMRRVMETWADLESYRNFVPLTTPKIDRDLFLVNLTTLLVVLKTNYRPTRSLKTEA